MFIESKYKFKGSHHAVDTLTQLAGLLFLRNIYVSKCMHTETPEITFERTYFAKENAIGTYVQEWEFVRNEIFANSARSMAFSRPSTSSYSVDDGKLYSAIHNEVSITLRFDFPDFVHCR